MNKHETNIKNLIAISYKFKENVFNDSKIYCYINLLKIIDDRIFKMNNIITTETTNNILNSLYYDNINYTFTYFYSETKNYISTRVNNYLTSTEDEDVSNLINTLDFPDNTSDLITLDLCISLFENAYIMLNSSINNKKLSALIKNNLHNYREDIRTYNMLNKISKIQLD